MGSFVYVYGKYREIQTSVGTIEGFKIESKKRTKRGRILLCIYNENRTQYEVYDERNLNCPIGTDDTDSYIAYLDAIETINSRIRRLW